ncbi:GNAT family N-acetyltransferase [Dactylosporangium sp. CS-033363]|uniref:GNAT family N-acetyltransferase n=1 Tax=Dactylosporangium sp. CS-033363 TaxID=3239935 RepID=UPI003D8CFD4C
MTEIEIGGLEDGDRPAWQELFRGYNAFYGREWPEERYEQAWHRFRQDDRIHALVARLEGKAVGLTHFMFHPSTTGGDVCYLQDLFTDAELRGRGVARALIAAVAEVARNQGCERVYWHTREDNATARRLYDKVAENRGFIQYVVPLTPG